MTEQFICSLCQYSTTDKSNYVRHCKSKAHTRAVECGSKYVSYTCKCGFKTSHKGDFNKHKCNRFNVLVHISKLVEEKEKLVEQSTNFYNKWSKLNEYVNKFGHLTPEKIRNQYEQLGTNCDTIDDKIDTLDDKLDEYKKVMMNALHPYSSRDVFEDIFNNFKMDQKKIKFKKVKKC